MQQIDIYDCYTRNAAGFSNVVQDLKFRSKTPKRHHQIKNSALGKKHWDLCDNYVTDQWDLKTWFFAYMAHRATGSGASFTRDHGYRNNCVHEWGVMESMDQMIENIKERKANKIPTFTSIGNQPPAPRKGVSVVDYITDELPGLLDNLTEPNLLCHRNLHCQKQSIRSRSVLRCPWPLRPRPNTSPDGLARYNSLRSPTAS